MARSLCFQLGGQGSRCFFSLSTKFDFAWCCGDFAWRASLAELYVWARVAELCGRAFSRVLGDFCFFGCALDAAVVGARHF